jgi:hypothetical protein
MENWEIGWQLLRCQVRCPELKQSPKHEQSTSDFTQNTTAMRERKEDLRQHLITQKLLLQKPPELWAQNRGGPTELSQLDPTLAQVRVGHEDDGQQPTIH